MAEDAFDVRSLSRRKNPAQWVFTEEDQFGGQEYDLAGGALELNIQLVPLPLVSSDDGVVFDPLTEVICCFCCPDTRSWVNDGPAVAEHMGNNLAGLVRDVHGRLREGSREVVVHNSTVVLTGRVVSGRVGMLT